MKKIIKISKMAVVFPLLISCAIPNIAEAGELIGGVRSRNDSGYYGTGSMTNAQRLSGYPLQQRAPFLLESSYHGANYYSYRHAVRRYKQNLRNYELGGRSSYVRSDIGVQAASGCAGNSAWCQQEARIHGGYSPSANIRLISNNRATRVVPRTNGDRAIVKTPAYVARDIIINPSAKIIPKIETVKQKDLAAEKANDLSFLSDPSKNSVKTESEEGKQSIWSHFQRALTGY